MALSGNLYGLLLIILLWGCSSIEASHKLPVGGKDGWVVHPTESYADWASRLRFQINDVLEFKYNKGEDSVLEVSKQDFDSCNTDHPVAKFDDGNSLYTFKRSGPHYFLSGNKQHCQDGQKLIIVVLSAEHSLHPSPISHPPMATPAPGASSSAPSLSPLPATTPQHPNPPSSSAGPATSPSHAAGGHAPSYAPTQSPSTATGGNAPSYSPTQGPSSSSSSQAPSYAPTHGPSPAVTTPSSPQGSPVPGAASPSSKGSSSPATSPSSAVSPGGSAAPETSPSLSPSAPASSSPGAAPAGTPGASLPGSPGESPAPSPEEGGGSAAEKSPSAGLELTATSVVVLPAIVAALWMI